MLPEGDYLRIVYHMILSWRYTSTGRYGAIPKQLVCVTNLTIRSQ